MSEDKQPDKKEGETVTKDDAAPNKDQPKEQGGPQGPEPTRFGDWERKGRCVDF